MVAHTLINALIVSTEYDDVAFEREVVGNVLVKLLAVGRSIDYLIVIALGLQCRNTAVDGFALHHHTCKSSVRIVVYTAPLVGRVVAQIVQVNFCQSLLLGAGKYRFVNKALKHFGQYGYYVYSHTCKFTQFRSSDQVFQSTIYKTLPFITPYVWQIE